MIQRKSVKKIFAATVTAILIFLNLPLSAGCAGKIPTIAEITIGTTKKHGAAMSALVDRFNAENPEAKVSLRVYESETKKNYYLSHGADDCDMYTFDQAVTANEFCKQLSSLDRNSCTNRYMISVINGLRAANGSLYVLPADGFCYTQGYNASLLASRGMAVPTTISELKLLAARLKSSLDSDGGACATVGGKDSVMFALMSVAFPLFLNTVEGAYALLRVSTGEIAINDAKYVSAWKDVFDNLKVLYEGKFYSLTDLDKSHEEGMSRFNEGKAYAVQNAVEVMPAARLLNEISVTYTPFLGNEARDACFGSMPSLYLAVAAKANVAPEKRAIEKFLNYFATQDGQKQIRDDSDVDQYVSYLKTSSANLPDVYSGLQSIVDKGRLFVVDTFNYVFGERIDEVIRFLKNEENVDSMLHKINEQLEAARNTGAYAIAKIDNGFDFNEEETYTRETSLGRFYAEAFTNGDFVDGVLIPSKAIKAALLGGTLTKKELYCVFEDFELAYAGMSVSAFAEAYAKIAEDCFPLTAKLTVKDGNVYDYSGRPLSKNAMIYVLMPKRIAESSDSSTEIGKIVSSNEKLLNYFNSLTMKQP